MNIFHNSRTWISKSFVASALFGMIVMATAVEADDVEIYLQPPPDPVPPNLLFILDESGSMRSGRPSKMSQMQEAMYALLDDPDMSNINAAILGYTTYDGNNTWLRVRRHSDFEKIETNRKAMKSAVSQMSPRSYTPIVKTLEAAVKWFEDESATAYNSRAYEITGRSRWDYDVRRTARSPINPDENGDNLWCQPNVMVLLTDGLPNSNSTTSGRKYGLTSYKAGEPFGSENCKPVPEEVCSDDGGGTQCGRCAAEIARYAWNTDLRPNNDPSAWPEVQNVKTHTIGFQTNDTHRGFLESISVANGGGNHYDAANASDLVDAFTEIAEDAMSSIPYTYTAPSIPFNENNAAVSGDRIYVPTFEPQARKFWKGNVKKYQIGVETVTNPSPPPATTEELFIRDKTGADVVNDVYLFVDSQDYWNVSGGGDDGMPLLGGANSRMGYPNIRNLYTYGVGGPRLLTDTGNRVTKANTNITTNLLGLGDSSTATEERRATLLDWIDWSDNRDWMFTDTPDDDPANDHLVWQMGAPLHTAPVHVNYASGNVVYMATTEGVLHALDADTGKELWGFMPMQLLENIKVLESNEGSDTPYYGLDGPMTYYEIGSEKYLAFSMRRGGRNLYALNITDRTAPKYAWGMFGTDDTNMPIHQQKLGQTWSKPIYAEKIHYNGSTINNVLIFGGGYDPDQDDAISRSDDNWGNAIYIVGAADGSVKKLITNAGGDLNIPEMKNAIAGDLLLVDINANRIPDRIYAADVGGRIIRVDIPDNDFGSPNPKGAVIADINQGSSTYRRFFNTPEVGYFSRGGVQFLSILIGSGHRPEPLDKSVTDRFYMIKDYNVWTAPSVAYDTWTQNDLYDATTTVNRTLNGMHGWYIDLGYGEKVFSKAKLYDYAVLFTSYTGDRSQDTNPCNANSTTGSSYFYALHMLDGNAYFAAMDGQDTDGDPTISDRKAALSIPGMPPAPTLLFPSTDPGAESLGREVIALVGLEEVTRWPDRFHAISWEEVIED